MKHSSKGPSSGKDNPAAGAVSNCVQCGRCSAACQVSFVGGESPRKMVRFLQRGDLERASRCGFLRLCKQCRDCTLTCPQGVDVADIMRDLARYHFTRYGHDERN